MYELGTILNDYDKLKKIKTREGGQEKALQIFLAEVKGAFRPLSAEVGLTA